MSTNVIRAGIRGDGYEDLQIALRTLAPFKTSGSFRGERNPSIWASKGHLPPEWRAKFRASLAEGTVEYVVYSYDTPIAWVVDGQVIRPPVKYSVTTTRHQGFLYLLNQG